MLTRSTTRTFTPSENLVELDATSLVYFIQETEDGLYELKFGDDIFDYLPLKPTECFNGFGYMDSLIKKGYVYKKKHIMCGNQFRNVEESEFSKRYTENIDNIMREHICIKHKNIRTGWSPKIK